MEYERVSDITAIWPAEPNPDGAMRRRQYRTPSFGWLLPHQARQRLAESGFAVDACFGDLARAPCDAASAMGQVWITHRGTAS